MNYYQNAQNEYTAIKKSVKDSKEDRSIQEEYVLKWMIRHTAEKNTHQWYFAREVSVAHRTFTAPYNDTLSITYKGQARISELSKKYPRVFESKKCGIYSIYRIRYEELYYSANDLPENLLNTLKSELDKAYGEGRLFVIEQKRTGEPLKTPDNYVEPIKKPSYKVVIRDGKRVAIMI